MPDPTSLLEIGARLAVTRKALGLTQAEMDRRMGSGLTNGQSFNFYETGRQRIPTHHALALCRTCNITLDWIYRGQMHSLQPDICAKIESELEGEDDALGSARRNRQSFDQLDCPTVSAITAPRSPRGLSRPVVESRAV